MQPSRLNRLLRWSWWGAVISITALLLAANWLSVLHHRRQASELQGVRVAWKTSTDALALQNQQLIRVTHLRRQLETPDAFRQALATYSQYDLATQLEEQLAESELDEILFFERNTSFPSSKLWLWLPTPGQTLAIESTVYQRGHSPPAASTFFELPLAAQRLHLLECDMVQSGRMRVESCKLRFNDRIIWSRDLAGLQITSLNGQFFARVANIVREPNTISSDWLSRPRAALVSNYTEGNWLVIHDRQYMLDPQPGTDEQTAHNSPDSIGVRSYLRSTGPFFCEATARLQQTVAERHFRLRWSNTRGKYRLTGLNPDMD